MHYGLELISNVLPPKGKKVLDVIIAFISLVLIAVLAYLAWVLTANVGTKIMTAMRISYKWFDLGMAAGLSLMFIYQIEIFVKKAKTLITKES